MHNAFDAFFNLIWAHGWLGFLGYLAYFITGTIVLLNSLFRSTGKLHFGRFFVLCILTGPFGWFSYISWFFFRCCTLVDVSALGKWISRA